MKKLLSLFTAIFLLTIGIAGCDGGSSGGTPGATYIVTYNGNNADIGDVPVDTKEYKYGQIVTIRGNTGNLAKSGHSFAGWTRNQDGSEQIYTQGQTIEIEDADIEFFAKWTLNPTYTVTFDSNNADSGNVPVDNTNYETGTTVHVPGNTGSLIKAGHNFTGWTHPNGTTYTQGQTFQMGSQNITLIARWTVKPTYTVTYLPAEAESGEVPVDTTRYETGDEVYVLENTGNLERDGYSFNGWRTSNWNLYTPGQYFTMGNNNVTLYPRWLTIPRYTVTYNKNGATSGDAPVDNTLYQNGHTVTVSGNPGNLTKTNHIFAGWNRQANGEGTNYSENDQFNMGTSNVTLYAKWIYTGAGGLDYTFDPGTGADGIIYDVALLSNGQIIIAGSFNNYNGTRRLKIARLNSDGSLDETFNPGEWLDPSIGGIKTIAIQPDGKILIGGSFRNISNDPNKRYILRLNADGSMDTTFNTTGTGFNDWVEKIALLSTGQIVVGGNFNLYNGTVRNGVALLNIDGSLDLNFNPGGEIKDYTVDPVKAIFITESDEIYISGMVWHDANTGSLFSFIKLNSDGSHNYHSISTGDKDITSLVVQPDGKVLVGSTRSSYLYRVTELGYNDSTFNSNVYSPCYIYDVKIQNDNKILFAGGFNKYAGKDRQGIARINSNGTLDTSFDTSKGSNITYKMAIQPDGKIIIVGNFSFYKGEPRKNIARIKN